MKISVIVPVYNTARYLERCIRSILNQSYSDLEVILVDDGSSDGSGEICDVFVQADNRVHCIHNGNNGVSYSRNCGLAVAEGGYIAFCDSDDYYSQDYLEKMVSAFESQSVDMVVCSYYYAGKKGIIHPFVCGESRQITKEEFMESIFIKNDIGGYSWNKLFKKSVLKGIRFECDLQICEDTYFVCQVLQRITSIYYLTEPLYYYTVRGDSAVNQINNIVSPNRRSKYAEVFNRLLDMHVWTEEIRCYIRCGIFRSSASVKCNYINSGGKDRFFLKSLNQDCKQNFFTFVLCKKVSLMKKAITILNWLFNLRKLKKIGKAAVSKVYGNYLL